MEKIEAKTKEKWELPGKNLKIKANAMPATIQIGKSGINASLIEEIKKQLKKRKLIKVKMLRSFAGELPAKEKQKIAENIAEKTNSYLVERIGGTIVLTKL